MSRHSMISWRKANPLKDSYNNLKSNAKRRGKVFKISFEYFKKFAVESEYAVKKGRGAQCFHVDRIDEEKGYVEGNLQALPNVDNVKKYVAFKGRDQNGAKFETVTEKPREQGDAPF